ncbi:hypothetical protein, partial [Staphylococcus pseudintermedius]|uniref:hypothetical protein n=1 Tax=Staphylococcus pseudintermedius TaxID=283734 RepID=UPI0036F249BA
KKQKSKTSFTGAFDFLVQKGLMGQPPLFSFNNKGIKEVKRTLSCFIGLYKDVGFNKIVTPVHSSLNSL